MNDKLNALMANSEKAVKAKERKLKSLKEKIKFTTWTVLMVLAGICYTISYYEWQEFKADYLTAETHATRIIENRHAEVVEPQQEAATEVTPVTNGDQTEQDTPRESRTVSMSDIEKKICDTFPEDCEIMIAIAYAENRTLNSAPKPNVNSNGSIDCGLMQVNSIHGYDCDYLENIENNLKVAREVYDRQGLQAWSTYKSGRYLSFLQ